MRVMSEEKLNKLAEFIKQYARDNNGESPSLADIMDYTGMVKSTAYRHVLERCDLIYRQENLVVSSAA